MYSNTGTRCELSNDPPPATVTRDVTWSEDWPERQINVNHALEVSCRQPSVLPASSARVPSCLGSIVFVFVPVCPRPVLHLVQTPSRLPSTLCRPHPVCLPPCAGPIPSISQPVQAPSRLYPTLCRPHPVYIPTCAGPIPSISHPVQAPSRLYPTLCRPHPVYIPTCAGPIPSISHPVQAPSRLYPTLCRPQHVSVPSCV